MNRLQGGADPALPPAGKIVWRARRLSLTLPRAPDHGWPMSQITTLAGEPVSRFAFGTMQFGGRADPAASHAMFDAARTRGITHFDTAHVYTEGASETLLGKFARAERESLYIATKAGYSGGSTAETIRRTFDISRGRLGMDAVDLLYLHRWDGETPLEETFQCLAELQQAGLTRHIGVSNFAAWQVVKAQWVARDFGTRIDWIQPMMNLVKRQAEVEILPMAEDLGIEVAPYSPLGGGLLTGKYAGDKASGRLTEDKAYAARYAPPWMREAAAGLAEIARREGVAAATLAVAWLARHAPRVRPILSARSAEQLAPSLKAMTFEMSDGLYEEITALSPAPPPATDRLEEA